MFSFKLGHDDALHFWVIVFVMETMSLHGEGPHLVVIEGTDSVNVGPLTERLQLLLAFVNAEDLSDAVVMVTNVVLVLKNL